MNAETKHGGAVDVGNLKAIAASDSDTAKTSAILNAAREIERLRAAVAELIGAHKALYKHYVNTLESGRDRIISLGGDCDPVDRMEQGDPVLAHSREILANIRSAS